MPRFWMTALEQTSCSFEVTAANSAKARYRVAQHVALHHHHVQPVSFPGGQARRIDLASNATVVLNALVSAIGLLS